MKFSQSSDKDRTAEVTLLVATKLAPKHIRTCLSWTIYVGAGVNDDQLGQTIGKYSKYWPDTAIVPTVATAGMQNVLAARTGSAAVDGVRGRCCALEEHLNENVNTDRASREYRTFRAMPGQIGANASNARRYDPVRLRNERCCT